MATKWRGKSKYLSKNCYVKMVLCNLVEIEWLLHCYFAIGWLLRGSRNMDSQSYVIFFFF